MTTQTEITSVIDGWSRNRRVLGRLLNTCSYLEHIASVKILTTKVGTPEWVAVHQPELVKHASFFKRALRGVWHGDFSRYEDHMLIGGRAAFAYMQKLEILVRNTIRESKIKPIGDSTYLLTTWLAESRANSLYPLMNDVFAAQRIPVSLRNVIADHERYYAELQEQMKKIAKIKPVLLSELLVAEEELFTRFFNGMVEDTVRVQKPAAALETAATN